MRIATLALATVLLFPAVSLAGKINGTLRVNGKPAPPGVNITIDCGGRSYPGATGARGSYSFYVNQTGNCTFTLPDYGSVSYNIHSYRDPVRYDFDLTRHGNGYQLRRR